MKRVLSVIAISCVALTTLIVPPTVCAEMADAFVYRVENPDKVTALQIALCNKFKYRETITDPDHVGEVDENGDLYPKIPNPEDCAAFANRSLIIWLDTMIESDTSATMLVDIEENVEDITAAKMDILGESEIVSQSANDSTAE